MLKEKILTLATGATGAGAIEAVEVAQTFDPATVTEGVSLLSQVIILVATLFGLFKKKKAVN